MVLKLENSNIMTEDFAFMLTSMLIGVPLAATLYRLVKDDVKSVDSGKEKIVGDSH